ncbi:MAG: toprim domain-containing protein, partial [archaeon]
MVAMRKELEKELAKFKKYLIIVEGKRDRQALEEIGFSNIFVINETGKSLYEKIEQIENIAGKTKVCILTDFDKKGKQLYIILKRELVKEGVKLDNKLRDILAGEKISHIEGLSSYIKKLALI